MSIFIDLEMNTTDTRLVRRKELKNEVIEIGAAAIRLHLQCNLCNIQNHDT